MTDTDDLTPEELMNRIEAFLAADMPANARHTAELLRENYPDVSIEELIQGDLERERLFDGMEEELL